VGNHLVGGVLGITVGIVLLYAVTHGYTKNLNSAWNALLGSGSAAAPANPFLPAGGGGFDGGASGQWGPASPLSLYTQGSALDLPQPGGMHA